MSKPWDLTETQRQQVREARIAAKHRQETTERELRDRFSTWLAELDDGQLAALTANWASVMDDAALTRIASWIIAGRAITELRSQKP